MATRSTTGCYTCRRRKKKCDETHPKCQRCARAGIPCEGYAPLENPDSRGIMRRSKVAPSAVGSDRTATLATTSHKNPIPSSSGTSHLSKDQQNVSTSKKVVAASSTAHRSKKSSADPNLDLSPRVNSDSPSSSRDSSAPVELPLEPSTTPHASQQVLAQFLDNLQSATGDSPPTDQQSAFSSGFSSSGSSSGLARCPSITSSSSSSGSSVKTPVFLTPGQASLFQSLFSLARPEDDLEQVQPSSADPLPRITYGPSWPSPDSNDDEGEESTASDDEDREGIKQVMCTRLTPDPNTESNALSFVLQSYARWVNFMLFDPSKVVWLMREVVIGQFSSSQDARTKIIFMANIIGALSKTPKLNARGMSIVSFLRTKAHQSIDQFNSSEPSQWREADMQNASAALDLMMEVIMIQRFCGPISTIVGLMEAATPVFLRACPEPPERLVSLPRILLSYSINLRNFVVTDVMISILLARPLSVKYDVSYTPEMIIQLSQGELGLQWLHGIPDQFIILLAWISLLFEEFGSNVDYQYVTQIEQEIASVRVTPIASADPVAAVRRLAVQESWRLSVYVYLYVTLCGAPADDPRVTKHVKALVRLMDGVRPGRNPDTFLSFPIMLIGTYAIQKEDRDMVYNRLTGLPECTNPITSGHQCVMVLVDVWKRTDAEQRPAVWGDLRIACRRIGGV